MTPADLVTSEPEAVSLGAIERQLTRPWQLGDAPPDEQSGRALMGNLVVVCRHEREEAEIAEDLVAIVSQYPSRVLVLVADAGNQTSEIKASVRLYGRRRGASWPVCGECVTIRAGGPAIPRLPSVVRAIVQGDLPSALWWATPEAPPLAGELFVQLADLVDQVIYDSFAWTDPLRQLILTASRVGENGRKVMSDLAWRRPKLWRRIIAQSLDPLLAPGALEAMSEVHIEHGPHALTQAWLLTGWLAFRLGWLPRGGKVLPGPEVSWSFQSAQGTPQVEIRRRPEGEPDLQSIRIVTRVNARLVTFQFTSPAPGRVNVFADGLSDRTAWLTGPVYTRGQLGARQLPDLARDRLFESSVALARTMAEAVL
ncbi:MAG: hypothetical protein AUH81_11885 [Candidatus Rokubacteria bacterium 13_1_40CM_4_69_5]|nr:MAG: hypothetical protein AUH81_11885 [Candidatus Rokubacteria bacterium 13_1_40CM_4_69_5]